MFNNIVIIIILFLVIGIFIYFYYHNKKSSYHEKNKKSNSLNGSMMDKKNCKDDENTELSISSILSDSIISNVNPYNTDISEHKWDNYFGLPLMSKEEKDKYVKKVKNNYQMYEKSLGRFMDYQIDNTVIKNDYIDNPKEFWARFKDHTIADIYDKHVAGIKNKSK